MFERVIELLLIRGYVGVPHGQPATQTALVAIEIRSERREKLTYHCSFSRQGGGAWSDASQWGQFQQSGPSSSAHAQTQPGQQKTQRKDHVEYPTPLGFRPCL